MSAVPISSYENVAGNAYDKYHTRNPIARRLMRGFLAAFDQLAEKGQPARAYEIGCGEGHLSARLMGQGIDACGCDLDPEIVGTANDLSAQLGKGKRFDVRSIYDFAPGEVETDLIVCCEVLEHLPDPATALKILASQRARHWLISVPREPVWRALNLARGKYATALGNTPGHIQHWSSSAFIREVEAHLKIVAVRRPLPWTMLLCEARPGGRG
jgi:SAM-dependent methyltransferase